MSSETASKRAKKLVNQLFELQYFDIELTAPFCLSTKHHLRSSRHCRAVEVLEGPDTALTIPSDRDAVPRFILSQLEAQKLTDQDSTSELFLSPLIHFILSCIPACLSPENSAATLFYWQSLETHRTFCIFAFVGSAVNMSSYRYTPQQLLDLRDRGVPMSLENAPQKGINHALQSSSIGRQIGGESRTLGRFHKFKAFHTQQPSTLRPKLDFPSAPEDVAFVRHQPRREATASISSDMEWRYRGRAGSEAAASAEPLSAPTGINAQQSEGFQRFYKAVISPTHVRVTAGGRIVPNTRGTSPVPKRPKEKVEEGGHAKDNTQHADDQAQHLPDGSQLAGHRVPNLPVFAFPPHPFYPPFPTPMPGMPMMPLPMGLGLAGGLPGGFSFPHQPGPSGSAFPFVSPEMLIAAAKENLHHGSLRESAGIKAPGHDKTEENHRRGPSEQFDRAKSFSVNGQVVYPIAPPAIPSHLASGPHAQFPPGFLGHPGFPLPAFHNPLLGPPPVGMNQMFNASLGFPAMPGPFQAQPTSVNPAGPPALTNAATNSAPANVPQPPSAPPLSSIRPSEISRKQIDMLRSSLKYHEDQLLYNRHQIDEKEMEHTIQMLQSQIDRFEALNQSQLRFEESHYPKKETKPADPPIPNPRASNRGSQSNTSFQGTIKHVSSSTRRSDSIRHKHFPRKKESLFNLNPIDPAVLLIDPVKKSTLPSRAALAPPFEPRSLASGVRVDAPRVGGSFQWDGTAVDEETVVNNPTGTGSMRGSVQHKPRSSSSAATKLGLGKPYLIGTLPAGIDPKTARDTNYVYERELTQDETRSRYLYWGRAPSFTRRGLPKFDGKDFYPASPSAEAHRESSPPPLLSRRIPIGDPNVDFYTGAFQPKDAQVVPGQYASSFRRERQKPVKVTLRRPDSEPLVKTAQSADDKTAQAVNEPAKGVDKSGKQVAVQPDNTRTKFLHTVLKRNISTNSEVLPGALTSATVQGVLPQYSTGYESLAAASLSPKKSSPMALGRLSPIKSDDGSSIFITPASRKVGENRPPLDSVGPVSLEQQFQGLTCLESKHDTSLPVQWSGL